jgi:colanic acid/amylovoran biosynthesis glycosyltransferase
MSDKPRIAIYRDYLLPPSETFVRNQAEGLRRFLAYYFGLSVVPGISLPADRVVTINGGGLVGRFESAAFTRVGVAPLAALKLLQIRPKLVHAHFGVDASRVMTLAHALRLPLIATLHDYDVTTSDDELLKLASYSARYIRRRPRLNELATCFLAVSNFIKQKAVARGFPEQKIVVHYIGIDVDLFRPDSALERQPVLLFVGRLVAKKGARDLIQAMATVQRARPDVELVIIGDGPLRGELEAQAAASLTKYRFLGVQTSEQVRQWHQRAQAFCVPSVTSETGETEGLPIAILEAQATGLPLVSTYHAGIPEAVIHGETGLLAPEHEPEALAVEILKVLGNDDLRGRLAAAGRKRVEARFNFRRQNELLEEIYERVIERPGQTPRIAS